MATTACHTVQPICCHYQAFSPSLIRHLNALQGLGGAGSHPGGLPPGFPVNHMLMPPGMAHPLASLQNLQSYALFQVLTQSLKRMQGLKACYSSSDSFWLSQSDFTMSCKPPAATCSPITECEGHSVGRQSRGLCCAMWSRRCRGPGG